jgi:hypothetical protein
LDGWFLVVHVFNPPLLGQLQSIELGRQFFH